MLLSRYDHIKQLANISVDKLNSWYKKNKTVFWGTYAVSIIAYSYIFTSMGFNNHTLPHAWTHSYPSYRTFVEGRWFSDLLLWFLGTAGVQSSQMYISVGLYIVDGIILAEMFGAEGGLATFLSVVFFNVYPANIDRYSFPGNQIVFVMADTFAVLAVFILYRQKNTWKALLAAAPLFVLCFATYQPAIALAAFLVLAHCVLQVLQGDADERTVSFPYWRLASAVVAMALGMALYYVTVKMTIDLNTYESTHVNDISEAIAQILGSFPAFTEYFTVKSDYLPAALRWLPLTVVVLGVASLINASWRKGVRSFLAVILFIGLMPVSLHISYIVNSQTWANAGRIVYPYGVALLFFLVAIGRLKKLKMVSYSIFVSLIYFCIVLATQETNKAYLKVIFDTNKINRIAARIENVAPDLYTKQWPLVVIGNLGMNAQSYKSNPNTGNAAQLDTETFTYFRQTELLNFYFGRDVLVRPTIEQGTIAISSSLLRKPWPSPESVYITDGIVVVLLEKYRPGTPVTWTVGE